MEWEQGEYLSLEGKGCRSQSILQNVMKRKEDVGRVALVFYSFFFIFPYVIFGIFGFVLIPWLDKIENDFLSVLIMLPLVFLVMAITGNGITYMCQYTLKTQKEKGG